MPRKYLRSVESSYQLEDDSQPTSATKSMDLADEVLNDNFSSYDPDDYYLRATDYKGHSISIKVTLPTNWGPLIAKIVDDDHNPYRSPVDFARDSVIHGMVKQMRAIRDRGGDDPTNEWFTMAQSDAYHAITELKQEYLTTTETILDSACRVRDWDTMRRFLRDLQTIDMPGVLANRRDEIVRKYQTELPI